MKKTFKETSNTILLGLIFVIAAGLFNAVFSNATYDIPRMQSFLYDSAMDAMGAMVCAALYFGSMRQKGTSAGVFRILIVAVSIAFTLNLLVYFTSDETSLRAWNFVFTLASKLVDIAMISLFYLYVRETLSFEGKFAKVTDRVIPVLMVLQTLVLLSNIFYPVTFMIDAGVTYHATGLSWAEDIYLAAAAVMVTILILRCSSARSQKFAALTFVVLPVVFYVLLEGTFGNASQYGMVLLSLIIMYCIIFNGQSSKLESTQAELNMAREIQASMLPSIFPPFPNREEFDLYASMDPAKEVGGDFYDFFLIDDDHLGIVIADVSGKGVPAALFMMISKTVIQNFAMLGISASELLAKANESLCSNNRMEMFVTTWIGILQISTGKMTCASAGHEYPAICHDGKYELFMDKHGFVLGGMEGSKYREYELQLKKGDKIFVYTDGVPEAMNRDNEMFGTDRMIDTLNTNAGADPEKTLKNVRQSVDTFVGGAEQFDDLTMLCLEYIG